MSEMVRNDAPVVEAREVTKCFDVSAPWLQRVVGRLPRRILRAVDGVSLTVNAAETLALVGESGCGKSTFARVLAGLYRPTSGSVRIFGMDPCGVSGEEATALRRRVNMIFQDPYASLNPRWKVSDIIAEPLRVQHPEFTDAQRKTRIEEAADLVRLPREALRKYPHQFSGGQRQRISIARALASHPDFLICDEPTSALDVSVQAQVLNLMKELQQQTDMAYLFISHNLAVVHHMSDRVGVMYLGRLVELGGKKEIFSSPRHPYTRMLLDVIPHISGAGGMRRTPVAGEVPSPLSPPSGCTFHPRCPHACERCRREVPAFRKVSAEGIAHYVACHLAQSPEHVG